MLLVTTEHGLIAELNTVDLALQQLLLSPVGFACVASPKTKGQSCFLRLQQQCSKQAEAGLPADADLCALPARPQQAPAASSLGAERLLQPQATKNLLQYTGRPPVHSPLPNTTHPLISAADGANVPEQEKNYSLKLPSIIHCSSMIHGCIIW
jgi:hypothetical protein